jgi:hypothetical protein
MSHLTKLTPDQLRDFTERDIGRRIAIKMRPAFYEPVEAILRSVNGHVVPLFVINEVVAGKILDSVILDDAGSAAEFLAEAQQAVISLRSNLAEIDRVKKIGDRDSGHVKQVREEITSDGKRKRGPGDTYEKRARKARDAAVALKEALRALTDLDRIELEERSRFDRLSLDHLSILLDELSVTFVPKPEKWTKVQRGRHVERPYEHRFFSDLAVCFRRFVDTPSHTYESATENYKGPFERFVQPVVELIRAEGISIDGDLPYLLRTAADRVKTLASKNQS